MTDDKHLVRVILTSHDGRDQHAEGYIKADILAERSILKRNGRVYVFASISGGAARFAEVRHLAYTVTEF